MKALKLGSRSVLCGGGAYYPNFEDGRARHRFVGNDDKGLGGVESAFDKEIRGQEGLVLQQDAHRRRMRRASSARRRLARRSSCRSISPCRNRRARLAPGSMRIARRSGTAIIGSAERRGLALANYPTFNPNSFGKCTETIGAIGPCRTCTTELDVQDRVTASAALREASSCRRISSTRTQAASLPGNPGRQRHAPHRRRDVRGRDRQLEQRRRHQDGIARRRRSAVALRIASASAKRSARIPGERGPRLQCGPHGRKRARLHVHGLPDQRDARCRWRPRPAPSPMAASSTSRTSSARNPRRRREPVAPKACGRRSRPKPQRRSRRSWRVVERGTAKAAGSIAIRRRDKTGTAKKVIDGHYTARDMQLVVRRLRARRVVRRSRCSC